MEEKKKRIHLLDEIRGFAIICMIIHHSFLDVGDVLGLNWGYRIFNALCLVQPVFWAAFIIISGVCTGLSRNAVKRHCLGFCMIAAGIAMPLIKKINYKAGAIVSAVLFLFFYGIDGGSIFFGLIDLPSSLMQNNLFAPLGLHNAVFYSADYFPLIPWIFMFFTGAFLGKPVSEGKLPDTAYKKRSRFLSIVGRNSLWVYLAHQPVIYGIMLVIGLIIS